MVGEKDPRERGNNPQNACGKYLLPLIWFCLILWRVGFSDEEKLIVK